MKNIYFYITVLLITFFISCEKQADSSNPPPTGQGGSTARMTIAADNLYLVSNSELYTYDISEPETMVLLNKIMLSNPDVETIFPFRDKLFIGSQTGMFVFDISNPKKPSLLGTAMHFRSCDPVVANNDYAFVTLRSNNRGCGGTLNQLNIYDIQGNNIMTPKLLSEMNMPEPHGLGLKENALYVCMGTAGMNVLDVTDKKNPKSVKRMTTQGLASEFIDVIPYNDILITYVKGGIILYDISSPFNPVKLSEIKNS